MAIFEQNIKCDVEMFCWMLLNGIKSKQKDCTAAAKQLYSFRSPTQISPRFDFKLNTTGHSEESNVL